MEITKSSRHQKIIGEFGEKLICNWLSRSGFEILSVDHTGIDIIAYNPLTKKRLGISVKSRTRSPNTEEESVTIFKKNDRQKLLNACKAFACEPWIAIYVETLKFADIYLTSLENYDLKYRREGTTTEQWKMRKKDKETYEKDPYINHIRVEFKETNWEWKK